MKIYENQRKSAKIYENHRKSRKHEGKTRNTWETRETLGNTRNTWETQTRETHDVTTRL